MGMCLELRQELQQNCTLCGHRLDEDNSFEQAFFSAKWYSYCPKCGADVGEKRSRSMSWQKSVDKYIERR